MENNDIIKNMLKKAEQFDILSENLKDYEKHTKGYIFDSLVYRYKIALEKTLPYEIEAYKYSHMCNRTEAEFAVRKNQERDLKRFIEILNEGLGEHD